jgi:3'-phosphoadenosine 5'-phosphosulfate sulfotransferase (PAPS reductase)/FAD synthetase
MSDFIQNIIDKIIDQYMFADNTKRPWIIGFNGGKDSTVMLQLVWKALEQVKHFHGFVGRDIYVVCNDTMVENQKSAFNFSQFAGKQILLPFSESLFPALENISIHRKKFGF